MYIVSVYLMPRVDLLSPITEKFEGEGAAVAFAQNVVTEEVVHSRNGKIIFIPLHNIAHVEVEKNDGK